MTGGDYFNKGEAARLQARGLTRREALHDLQRLVKLWGDVPALAAKLGVLGLGLVRVLDGEMAFQEPYLEAVYGRRGRAIMGLLLAGPLKAAKVRGSSPPLAVIDALAADDAAGVEDPAGVSGEVPPSPPPAEPAVLELGAGLASAVALMTDLRAQMLAELNRRRAETERLEREADALLVALRLLDERAEAVADTAAAAA
jgi:hypothetical protein